MNLYIQRIHSNDGHLCLDLSSFTLGRCCHQEWYTIYYFSLQLHFSRTSLIHSSGTVLSFQSKVSCIRFHMPQTEPEHASFEEKILIQMTLRSGDRVGTKDSGALSDVTGDCSFQTLVSLFVCWPFSILSPRWGMRSMPVNRFRFTKLSVCHIKRKREPLYSRVYMKHCDRHSVVSAFAGSNIAWEI